MARASFHILQGITITAPRKETVRAFNIPPLIKVEPLIEVEAENLNLAPLGSRVLNKQVFEKKHSVGYLARRTRILLEQFSKRKIARDD